MPNTDQISTNPTVLVWARESLALSRSQASEKSGIADHRLAQLERGERSVTIEELHRLSKAYKRTIAALLLAEPPKEKPLPRDRRTVNSQDLGHFHPKTIMAVRRARAFASSYKELREELDLTIPEISISASLKDNAQDLAGQIRTVLNLKEVNDVIPEGDFSSALDAYINKVESLGIAVFQLSLSEDNLRGFSILDDVLPIIGIKRSDSPWAKNFTLFHELGHILLHEEGSCDLSPNTAVIEKWCNAFAAEVLIPHEELLKQSIVMEHRSRHEMEWRAVDLKEIGKHFYVGPLAILRGLLECGLTTQEFYKIKHVAWNKPSFGLAKNPKGPDRVKVILKEKGKTYVSLAFKAFDQNRINLKDLADYLGIKLSLIPRTRQFLNA